MATEKKILSVFQFRRDYTKNWELNKDTIPAAGEPCYDIDLRTLRIGDGKTTYENLPVIGNSESGDVSAIEAEVAAIKIALEILQADVDDMDTQLGTTNVVEIHNSVTTLTEQMQETQKEIDAVQQVLDDKVDSQAVEKLESDLKTYIEEQIKTVEIGNIDDGEI